MNAGSLEKDILEKYKEPCPEALVESAIRNIKVLEDEDFSNLKVSVKSSDVFLSIGAYRQLSNKIDYPLPLELQKLGVFTWNNKIINWFWSIIIGRYRRHY